jgi:hypothetical protein
MAKYYRIQKETPKKRWEIHPVWRGIGCLLMIIIPVISYVGAVMLVRENTRRAWVQVPEELSGWVDFSPIYRVLPALQPLFDSLGRIYYIDLILTVLLTVAGFALLTVLYSMIYSATGPDRYGPLDSPPIRKSTRRRSK